MRAATQQVAYRDRDPHRERRLAPAVATRACPGSPTRQISIARPVNHDTAPAVGWSATSVPSATSAGATPPEGGVARK
jgi:hypothetical protein